jgi:hypothetical protein
MEEATVKVSRRNSLKALTAALALPSSSRAADAAIQLVVLDVGGTIIEDRGDVVATLQSTMAKRGIVVSAAEIGPWRGAAKRAVIQHFVDLRSKKNDVDRQALTGEIYQDFNAQLNEAYRTVPPIAGAEEAIRKLRENGYLVAATTGFDREIVAFAVWVGKDTSKRSSLVMTSPAEGPRLICFFTRWKRLEWITSARLWLSETRRSTCKRRTMRACEEWWECSPVPVPRSSFVASRTRICSQASRACLRYSDRSTDLLRGGLGGFFGFTRGNFGLQRAILGAAVDFLFAKAVESRGIATCFRHEFLFS